jgi:hypothetical protein
VRRRVVPRVEHVLEVHLRPHAPAQPHERRRVEPREGRQRHGVVDRRVRPPLPEHAEPEPESRRDLHPVPQRRRARRHERHRRAGPRARGARPVQRPLRDEPAGHLPARGDLAGGAELHARRPLRAGLHEERRVGGVGGRGVVAVQLVGRRGEREARPGVPLRADLLVDEPLGPQRLGGRRERRELVARRREERRRARRVHARRLGRLVDEPEARRHEPVVAAQRLAVAAVVEAHREAFDAHAGERLQPRRQGHLVLHVARRHAGDHEVVRVRGALAERHRHRRLRVGHRDERGLPRAPRRPEVAGLAQVARRLPPELGAREQRVPHRAGGHGAGQVGLVEQVVPVGRAVVARQVHVLRAERVLDGAAREHVLVELVVGRHAAPVAHGEPAAAEVLDRHVRRVEAERRGARRRVAEEGGDRRARRPPLVRRQPAVDGAPVLEPLVAGADHRARA